MTKNEFEVFVKQPMLKEQREEEMKDNEELDDDLDDDEEVDSEVEDLIYNMGIWLKFISDRISAIEKKLDTLIETMGKK